VAQKENMTPYEFRNRLYVLWTQACDAFEGRVDSAIPSAFRADFEGWSSRTKELLLRLKPLDTGEDSGRELTLTEYGEMLVEQGAHDLKLSVKNGVWTCAITSEDGTVTRSIVAEHQEGPDQALHRALAALRKLPQYHPPEGERE